MTQTNQVIFTNPGNLDLRALTLMGLSAKPTSGSIGRFGTGLKFALASLARAEAEVRVQTSGVSWRLSFTKNTFRGQETQVVTLVPDSGDDPIILPFTTNLGVQWTPWMIYRELWSNAKDEGGDMLVANIQPAPMDGMTNIVVEWEPLLQVALRHKDYICEPEDALWSGSGLEVAPPGPTLVAYRGIRVMAKPNGVHACYTYNITDSLDLTEDRTVASEWQAKRLVVKGLLLCDDKAVLEAVLSARTGWESAFEWNGGYGPGATWLEVVLARAKARQWLPESALILLEASRPGTAKEIEAMLPETWDEAVALEPQVTEVAEQVSLWPLWEYIQKLEAAHKAEKARADYWKRVAQAAQGLVD